MNTKILEKFAQNARRQLLEQVAARLDRVLQTDSAELRDQATAVQDLRDEIYRSSREAVIDRVAYTWFNRFSALRYMDANHYTRTGIVSPAIDYTQPQILQEAKQGHIDDELAPYVDAQRVFDLLAGRLPSRDGQQEAYRLLLVAACNAYNKVMPFLFEEIADYTELLMPEDLLSPNSVLHGMREALTEEACQDVEVIGWLYQFYISERKDEVIGSKQKIQPEDIPAATQLFTPHWIVRYLVENSLGRLWLLNKPRSLLAERMDYYIRPEQEVTDFLHVSSPEVMTVCDPAVGSGHMLTYAFDLLYAIYEEEGYNPPDIPRLILEKNLVGLEIDERAGALAAFALTMKARAKDRRFLRRGVNPQITILHSPAIDQEELQKADWFRELGHSLLELPVQDALLHDLGMLRQVDNIGSLLRPELTPEQIAVLRVRINAGSDLFSHALNTQVIDALVQLEPLARLYHVTVTNPPYLSLRDANQALKIFAESQYPHSKTDLFSMFIVRCLSLNLTNGFAALVTMQSWMFLKSYQQLRKKVVEHKAIETLSQLGPHAFDEIGGERVQVAAFIIRNALCSEQHKPTFFRLLKGGSNKKKDMLLARQNSFTSVLQKDFRLFEDYAIAYKLLSVPSLYEKLEKGRFIPLNPKIGSQPGSKLILFWWEVDFHKVGNVFRKYNKGGGFKRWYGNNYWVLHYGHRGEVVTKEGGQLSNEEYYGLKHIGWSRVSSRLNVRSYKTGTFFDNTSPAIFSDLEFSIAYLNSKVAEFNRLGKYAGLKIEAGHIKGIPPIEPEPDIRQNVEDLAQRLIFTANEVWDQTELSWDFAANVIKTEGEDLAGIYDELRKYWDSLIGEAHQLEEDNNRLFIDYYGLWDELTPDVPLDEITLTCNPNYRYGSKKSAKELETLLMADTMREFISYAVACMVGRYSLDMPGLILANQGETVEDYYRRVSLSRDAVQFAPDRDNVLPILDGDWFPDDIVGRFKRFLRVTFGDEYYEENLAFIENALGKDIRKYFLRDFYTHHVKMYKKRPIYWLFSSPKGSFNALIYMHRYRPDTVSVILNDYLRDFRAKLEAERAQQAAISVSAAATAREKTRADKEITKLDKMLKELRDYEDDILYPLAAQQIDIDLDDGVKVNYNKFGKALKKVAGLTAK